MSHLFWLHEANLKRIQHLFPKPRVARVDISAASSTSFGMACVGGMPRLIMGRIRRYTTDGPVGLTWASLRAS